MNYKIFISLALLFFSQLLMAEITVKVDRDPIVVDESFHVIFESDEKIDAKPDFSPLEKSFTILDSRHRSNTQITNGKISYSQMWVVSLIANRTGRIDIPAVRFGKQTTRPSVINVVASLSNKQSSSDEIFIEVEVDTENPYVQAQMIYTIKLYRSVATNNATLSDPELTGGQAIINKLGEDTSFETQRNGKRYVVIQRQYVIFPQSSGVMTIQPVVFQGQTGGPGGFFNFDPFGPQPRAIVKRSDSVEINVKAIPDSFTGDTWLPAKGLNIQEEWSVDPSNLMQGEATTRTLTLTATGLAASHLPAAQSVLPDSLKQYPDQPVFEENQKSNGFVGKRIDKMAVVPTTAGKITLPAVKIPWWNTTTDEMEIAELPERFIHAAVNPNTVVNTVVEQQAINPVDETHVETENNDDPITIDSTATASPLWKYLSLLFFALWVITLILFWRSKGKPVKEVKRQEKVSTRQNLKAIQQGCKNNDAHKTKQALLEWAKLSWPEKRINNINALKEYSDDSFNHALDELNKYLYGSSTSEWDGMRFLKVFESQSFKDENTKEVIGKLEPLYKA